jgi:plastocyanin
MMRPWLICFSVSLASGLAASRTSSGVTVSGVVEIVQRAQAHESLSDIVVWLEASDGAAREALQPQHARLLQKDKMFHPHVLAIGVGSVVDFPNADPIFHNGFSNFEGQLFDLGLYPPGTTRSIHFYRPGIVRVFCNIHPSMSAVIVVLDTPYFTKAGDDGRYRIANVPPGSYRLRVFDERATAGPEARVDVVVAGSDLQASAPPIRLSELGYVRPPHKNKFGLDYPVSASDSLTYKGVPQ